MQVCGDIMGFVSWESFQGFLVRRKIRLSISFGGINLFFTEDYAPFVLLGSWALMAPYFYYRFHIFNKLILDEYVS
jgi:hypothetical protein